MKHRVKRQKKGYTLIELSVVIVLVVLIASTLTSMLSQQLQFFKWWNTQKFIAEDAPLANNMVVRLFSNADVFRVHSTKAGAVAGTGGTTAGGSAVCLSYAQPGGGREYGVLYHDSTNQTIEYAKLTGGNAITAGDEWTLVSGIPSTSFDVVDGILAMTLTGPYGGEVTYYANSSL